MLILYIVVCLFLAGCRDKSVDHYNRGVDYLANGQYDQAISEFTRAIEINPGLAYAYSNRGVAYAGKGEYDLAISDFTKFLEIYPLDATVYNNRGVAYYNKGEYDKAWDDVHKAQSLGYQVHPEFLKDLREASGKEK